MAVVYFPLAIYIVIDSLLEDNYSNTLVPVYMLFLLPIIIASVYTFSKLETVQLNKYIKAVIFSFLSTSTLIVSYALANYIDTQELNLDSIYRFSILSFIIQTLLYIQLPWVKESDV